MSTLPAVLDQVDQRTLDILERRRRSAAIRRRGWLMRRMLLVSDLLGLTLAFVIAEAVYAHQVRAGVVDVGYETLLFGLSLPVWVLVAKLYGLFDHDEERVDHSTADDVVGVLHLVTIGTWILFIGAYVTRLANPQLPKLMLFWLCAVILVPAFRGLARTLCRRSVHYIQNTLIVGAGDVGQLVARKILRHHEYGFNIVGFVDGSPKERADDLQHLTVLGDLSDASALIQLLDVERVIVAFSNETHVELLELLRSLNELDVQVDIVPRFYEVLSKDVEVHSVEAVPLVALRPPRLAASSVIIKRLVDVCGSFAGLALLAPFFVLAAAMIKFDSRGPVFFRQLRVGARGRAFHVVKFRTMTVDAERRKHEFAHLNKHARVGGDARMFKIDGDPRVTRIGRILRRFSLDELPQLWNVLCGEMSLVGPRPLILEEDRYVEDWRRRRLELRPGITGLWQVLGRSDIPFEEMVRLDYLYVTSWSLPGDLKLIIRTLPALLRRGV